MERILQNTSVEKEMQWWDILRMTPTLGTHTIGTASRKPMKTTAYDLK
jgi:hypothetical protein